MDVTAAGALASSGIIDAGSGTATITDDNISALAYAHADGGITAISRDAAGISRPLESQTASDSASVAMDR